MPGLEKMDDFFAARVDSYDDHMPLLVDHETEILRRAGFRHVQILKKWGESTYTVIAHALESTARTSASADKDYVR